MAFERRILHPYLSLSVTPLSVCRGSCQETLRKAVSTVAFRQPTPTRSAEYAAQLKRMRSSGSFETAERPARPPVDPSPLYILKNSFLTGSLTVKIAFFCAGRK
ncbi:hypothetical protein TNCT_588081 [Trichonephila clavata]|uniref:Uncharacterized protein n=1 Tax=Trichonephila clavata TaxID=2740835 RepID=A0A8X6LB72_TRICU|nr:hypothetical protein TNCT_588081 [Trichonephila clavata]